MSLYICVTSLAGEGTDGGHGGQVEGHLGQVCRSMSWDKGQCYEVQNVLMGISIEWLFIDGDAKEATEKYSLQIRCGVFSKRMRFSQL